MGEPSQKPDVSQETINQIAREMDKQKQSINIKSKQELCQKMLSSMPEIDETISDATEDQPNELDKLLNNGYRPLHKTNGEWSECNPNPHNKLLLE
ncbi:MAG: hypothetical protein GF411_20550 [Candidatus Lokiarchaeota archaeon]|nr:hypothetical protein [Candidatus Lokiarchaeota archaeon]